MDTDSLFLALAEENLYDCFRPAKKNVWEKLRKMIAETHVERI